MVRGAGPDGRGPGPPGRVRIKARAKVNLWLSVRGRRPDGYHEIESVMQSIDIADRLEMRRASVTRVDFRWMGSGAPTEPERPDLVERAICIFARRTGAPWGAEVSVTKMIPLASGLAGGSADAAAALLGANALADHPLPAEELAGLAAEVGSDVPFTLRGGIALAGGRGERLRALDCRGRLWWAAAVSDFPLETTRVYRRHDSFGQVGDRSVESLVRAVATGSPERIAPLLRNDLEAAACDLEPSLGPLKSAIVEAGALGAVMSGSGPTLLGLCRDEVHARQVAGRLAPLFARVEVAPSTTAGAEILDIS
ncbi:MAG: 4-(cytidine 5'-diphospho)-2-C-methyl-D-erythritol kinase [Actinomycetota bacterium]